MTVRFDFELEDEDAQALFDVIDRVIEEAYRKGDPDDNDLPPAEQAWWRSHVRFLRALKLKLHNERVPPTLGPLVCLSDVAEPCRDGVRVQFPGGEGNIHWHEHDIEHAVPPEKKLAAYPSSALCAHIVTEGYALLLMKALRVAVEDLQKTRLQETP